MPDLTPNLGLKKPLGNETVSRAAYNENLDTLDAKAAKASDLAAHLADYAPHIPYAAASGSAYAYTVTLSPAPAAYTEGMALSLKINVDNTGASTLNVNGLGAKPIKKPNGNDVSAGNLKAGSIYTLRYNGTNFILQGSDSSGNAIPGDVIAGKTFSNDEDTDLVGTLALTGNAAVGDVISGKTFYNTNPKSKQTGTMPNQGAIVITPGTSNKAIAAGYHNGSGYVVGDADLVPANIKSGKNIFNVAGNVIEIVTTLEAGDNSWVSSDNVVAVSTTYFEKKKEIKVNASGTLRVYWEAKYQVDHATYVIYSRVYINGTAVGDTYSNGDDYYIPFTEDITVNAGDLVQLFARVSNSSYLGYVRNFRLCTSLPYPSASIEV